MFSLQKMCPITCIDSFYDLNSGAVFLLVGDEMGYIRVQDLSGILKEHSIVPVDVVAKNHKRNPWRVLPIEKAEQESYDTHTNDK